MFHQDINYLLLNKINSGFIVNIFLVSSMIKGSMHFNQLKVQIFHPINKIPI